MTASPLDPAPGEGFLALPRPPRVLVIEDNPAFRNVISLLLIREQYEVLTALHGAAALERIRDWQPDFIVLDMMMPVMTGMEFLREYQAVTGVRVTTIALTGAPELARDAGADFVLRKPVDVNELLGILESRTWRRIR